jgi:sporulation protein YlmC with PRC-barrel domain
MEQIDIDTALDWRGRTVIDREGEKIGTLENIYLDEDQRPRWGSIRTGLFGLRETLAPLDEAQQENDVVRLPFERDQVQQAPNLDPDVELAEDEEERLYRHYGLASDPDASSATGAVAAPADTPEPASTPDAPDDDAMTRSEEEVHISKRPRERGRARLKKYVVTDYVEKKVPVQREEVKVEYEPTDAPE